MAKFKYCVDGSEPLIKDLKAVAGSYYDGQVLVGAAVDGGGVRSAGAGIATTIIGVCNQDGSLPAVSGYGGGAGVLGGGGPAALTGTQALGTLENLKVLVSPGAVYALEYDQASPITYAANVDTQIDVPDGVAATGRPGFGGGWLWSLNTGALDYIVSSVLNGGNTEATVVTGNNTASTSGIYLYPASGGQSVVIELDSGATKIAAGGADVGVAGTNGIAGVIMENRLESLTYGSEILDCAVHNRQARFMTANASFRDKAKAFGYVRFNHALS